MLKFVIVLYAESTRVSCLCLIAVSISSNLRSKALRHQYFIQRQSSFMLGFLPCMRMPTR